MKTTFPARPLFARSFLWCTWLLLGCLAIYGAITFLHAWSMTHYAPTTERTTRAAEMSGWKRLIVLATGAKIRRQMNTRTPRDLGLAFETRTFRGAKGLRLEAWRVAGRAGRPAVLMFPGYGGSKDTLLAAAGEFASFGWEVWMVDPHGIGGSEGSSTSVGWHEADDVAAAFREFRAGSAAPCVLYGTSMGAVAILRAVHTAKVAPDGLILECPFDRFRHAVAAGYARFGLPGNLLGPATAAWVGVQQGFDAFEHDPVRYVASVRCPTLLMQGELDDTIGRAHVRNVGRRLGERGTFAFLEGAGHAHLPTRAAGVWRARVREFVRAQFPDASGE